MKFNFKVRAKNPLYWVAIVVSMLTYIGGYLGVKGEDVTSWAKLFSIIGDILSNPYLIVMLIITMITTAISYTDKGIKDTGFVQTLDKPRDDRDPEQAAGFLDEKKDNKVDLVRTPEEYPQEKSNEDIDEHSYDKNEEPYKNESKPYGVNWDEKVEDKNVEAIKHEN